ncbi:hypothetical protein ACFO4O_04380 [Glaciecola siphonariae]|uniref:Uncharacterized protein n=1 Tax=Glaciecola siphonariae TaxID=521012 RepID=A0ABV9LU63_9ALTE
MKFTVTDDLTNKIVGHIRLSAWQLRAAEDEPAFISAFIESETTLSQTAHKGYYPNNQYSFDGVDFNEIEHTRPTLSKEPRDLLVTLVKQLLDAGYSLPLHVDFIRNKKQARDLIDQAAGRARMRFVSQGLLIDQEYLIAEQEAKEWIAAGSDVNNVPETLDSWVAASGMTETAAASNITSTSAQFRGAIKSIRRIRLTGKKAVTDASLETFKAIAQTYINQLDAL